jgi:hypothetical protein
MSWDYLTASCASTSQMLGDLCDWLAAFPTAPFAKEAVGGAGVYTRTETLTNAVEGYITITGATTRCVSRGGVRWWIAHSDADGIFCKMSVASSAVSSTTWDSMSVTNGGDHSVHARCKPVYQANKYWFFRSSDDMQVHVRFRLSNGSWNAFSLGKISKSNDADWTGGEFFAPQCITTTSWGAIAAGDRPLFGMSGLGPQENGADLYSSAIVRVVFNGQKYGVLAGSINSYFPYTNTNKLTIHGGAQYNDYYLPTQLPYHVNGISPNAFNGRSVGAPIDLFIYDSVSTLKLFYLGNVPGIRIIGLGTTQAESVINNDWLAFPVFASGTVGDATPVSGFNPSGNLGVAYYCPTFTP